MCGIVGYVGPKDVVPILVEGLARLEYRGYDSAGIAVLNGHGLETRKLAGRIQGLRDLVARAPVQGTCGIGHTRWATHGAPTERNAHPHADCTGTIALVHNGIVENADVLRAQLERDGHRFATETDTETLAHLVEESPGETLEGRVIAALAHVEGTYGVAVISEREPHKIVVARRGSPVLLGIGDGEYIVASDASAVLSHTRSVVYLDDGDVAVVTPEGYRVLDREARLMNRAVDDIEWDLEALALGGYPHFMLKEISEQPETVRSVPRTVSGCSLISFSMKWGYPPNASASRSHSMSSTARFMSRASRSSTRYPSGVTTATSPSSRYTTERVCESTALASDATMYSPSPIPSSTGDPRRATTI